LFAGQIIKDWVNQHQVGLVSSTSLETFRAGGSRFHCVALLPKQFRHVRAARGFLVNEEYFSRGHACFS
jgi:hypothetical protein